VVISTPAAHLLARPDLGEVFLGHVATPEPGPPQSTQAPPPGPHRARFPEPGTAQR
jgi:hypothetical protein